MKELELHPYVRAYMLLIGFIGTMLCGNFILLAIFQALLLPIIIINKLLKLTLSFVALVIAPMTLMFLVFHYFNEPSRHGIHLPESKTILKLSVYTTLMQIALVIPLKYVHQTFKQWRISGDLLLTITGSYFVWADIISRSERIILARFSKGYMSKRTLFKKLVQVPFVFIPLVIGIMRTANERSQSWHQKNLVVRISQIEFNKIPVSKSYNVCIVLIIAFWLGINIFYRYA